jgi:hypothetical protein
VATVLEDTFSTAATGREAAPEPEAAAVAGTEPVSTVATAVEETPPTTADDEPADAVQTVSIGSTEPATPVAAEPETVAAEPDAAAADPSTHEAALPEASAAEPDDAANDDRNSK